MNWLNNQLAIQGSEYRVIELGMDQGNSVLAYGMIPLKEGDLVLHNIALKAYRWLEFTILPDYQMMEIFEAQDFWEFPEWDIPQKLEQASLKNPFMPITIAIQMDLHGGTST